MKKNLVVVGFGGMGSWHVGHAEKSDVVNLKGIYDIDPKKIELVRAATQYIYENYHKDISLEEIAESLNVSKYYLSHIFKEATGKTVLNHLNYVRCTNANTMLSSGKYSVSQSAFASGFSNLSYFSKTYKSVIGNSPKNDIKQ